MIKLFVGVPGSGKSLAMQDTVRLLNRAGQGCVIVDRTNEWGLLDKDENPNARWRGDPPPLTALSLDGDTEDIRQALTLARDEGKSCVFQTDRCFDVGKWVRAIGDLFYVDDEIDLTARVKDWHDNPLRAFVHTGRHLADETGYHREVHILGACRRVQNIHTDLTEMADEVFVFRSRGKNTIKRIIDEGWAEDSDIEDIRNQPSLHYQKWASNGYTSRGFLTPIKAS